MRLLLDTHTFLWLHTDRSRLPHPLMAALAALENNLLFSVASAWELGIKHALGKLPMPDPPAQWVSSRLKASGVVPLAVSLEHAFAAAALPPHHRDPFDRLLIGQAQADGLTLVTGDPAMSTYDVPILWD